MAEKFLVGDFATLFVQDKCCESSQDLGVYWGYI